MNVWVIRTSVLSTADARQGDRFETFLIGECQNVQRGLVEVGDTLLLGAGVPCWRIDMNQMCRREIGRVADGH